MPARVRTQARVTPAVLAAAATLAVVREASMSATIEAALRAHLPSQSPPPEREPGELVLVRFRIPFPLHQALVAERRRWGAGHSLVVEAALRSMTQGAPGEIDDYRRR